MCHWIPNVNFIRVKPVLFELRFSLLKMSKSNFTNVFINVFSKIGLYYFLKTTYFWTASISINLFFIFFSIYIYFQKKEQCSEFVICSFYAWCLRCCSETEIFVRQVSWKLLHYWVSVDQGCGEWLKTLVIVYFINLKRFLPAPWGSHS